MTAATIAPPATPPRRAGHAASAGAVALATLAALAPFDLAVPPDGWSRLHVRPLMTLVIVVSAGIILGRRKRIPSSFGPLELAIAIWLAAVWISTAVSDAPFVGAAGAIRLTAFGLLAIATRWVVGAPADARLVLRGLGIGLVAACGLGLIVFLAGHEVFGTDHLVGSINRVAGHPRLTRPWAHANVAGMAIGASLPALLLLGRAWRMVAAAVVVPALVLTYSRGAVIAVLAATVVILAIRRNRRDARPVLAVVALGLAVAVATPGWAARLDPPSPQDRHGAAIVAPRQLVLEPAGITAPISVSNLSAETWPASGVDRVELAARWVGAGQDWVWGEHRWALPGDMAPGESVEMDVAIDASIPIGTFDVRWDLVRGARGYFLHSGGRPVSSRGVVVDSPIDASALAPARLTPPRRPLDRIEIWDLALGELAAAPLLGVGPSELGLAVEDDIDATRRFGGRHAHSLLLEPLATTGALGAAPLFFALAGGLRLAARRARADRGAVALATLAGLTAALVHGLVDWPLVYTSAAIPIAVLTGVAWRSDRPRPDSAPASAQ